MSASPRFALGGLVLLAVGLPGCLQRNPDFVGASGGTTAGTTGTATTGPSAPGDSTDGGSLTSSTSDGEVDGEIGCAPSLDSLRDSVFSPDCTSADCHAGVAPAAALDLTNVDLHDDLLDVASTTCLSWSRVVASSPEESILYAKVAGLATCDVERAVAHDMLPSDELDCLSGWIETIVDCERCGGTECLDLASDAGHCGDCATVCPAGVACAGGVCACPQGTSACDGACVDTDSDPAHCGGCGNDCQGNACSSATCQCAGLTMCGGCVDTQTDAAHCGGCDQPCGFGRTCQDGACGCDPTPVSYAAHVQPVFTASCVAQGCHGGNNPKKDLRLEEGASWADLVDVPAVECDDGRMRVAPGNPDESYLMHKLLGVQICSGVQMPQSGGPGDSELSEEELGRISAWICQGALDN